MPILLKRIDELTRGQYYYLAPDDACFFWREYTSGRGFSYNDSNQLLSNFKKSMDRRGRPEFRHKIRAIRSLTREFGEALRLPSDSYRAALFVPIPPSKAKNDPLYDDRVMDVLRPHANNGHINVAELISQITSTEAAHKSENRLKPDQRKSMYQVGEIGYEGIDRIVLVDDILTTGCHFRACKDLLSTKFGLPVEGLFFARTVRPTPNFAEMFGDDN